MRDNEIENKKVDPVGETKNNGQLKKKKVDLNLTDKEKEYLKGMSKKERRKFINKANDLPEDHGMNGPWGKKYF